MARTYRKVRTGQRAMIFGGAPTLLALILSSACGVEGESGSGSDTTARPSSRSCQNVESFAGTTMVGNPPAATPTAVPMKPLQPGEEPTQPVRPTVREVKIEQDAQKDLVVFDLDGDGSVGWAVRFVQMPLLQGTNDPVSIAGSCVMQIDLIGVESSVTSLHRDVPERPSAEGDPSGVTEVLSYPSSNGLMQSFVGTRGGTPAVAVDTSVDRPAIVIEIASQG